MKREWVEKEDKEEAEMMVEKEGKKERRDLFCNSRSNSNMQNILGSIVFYGESL